MKPRSSAVFSFLLLAACVSACQAPPPKATSSASAQQAIPITVNPANLAPAQGKALLGIYVVGSDLEDDIKPRNGTPDEAETGEISTRGSGSNDLRELVDGWKALTPAQQASFDVLIAFGGARKQGWQGVKYSDMACLVTDRADDYFGNASCYSQSTPDSNLSDATTLEAFLKQLKAREPEYDRLIVDLWDHGAAFLGMGQDTNQPNGDLISLPALKQAFAASGLHVDLLGFDACLMASLEVASALQPHADYLLASQELEPGHGWNYADFAGLLATRSAVTEIGKGLIDSFITHPNHQKTRNKTLSLTDLRKLPNLLAPLDQLIGRLPADTAVPVLPSLQATPEFGVQSRGDVAYTIDLREFVNNITRFQPDVAAEGKAVLDQLQSAIVYSREDGSKPAAGGITIFSLNRELKPQYNEDQSISRTFLGFVEKWLSSQAQSSTAPKISADGFATTQLASALPECRSEQGLPGQCISVSSDRGASVAVIQGLQTPQGLQVLGRQRLQPLDLKASRYFAPRWDGHWFELCDGPCATGQSLRPSAIFSHSTRTNKRIYIAEAELNGRPVDVYLELDPGSGQVTSWLVPHAQTRGRVPIPSRLDLELSPGDSLAFASYAIQADGSLQRSLGQSISFSQVPAWRYGALHEQAGRPVYLIRASNATELSSLSATQPAAPPEAPLQSAAGGVPAIPALAASLSLAPAYATVSFAGDTLRPVVYIKDSDGQFLQLPLIWRSESPDFTVSPDGLITYQGGAGFGKVTATEPVSGLRASIELSVSRGGAGGASTPLMPPAFSVSSVTPRFGYNTSLTSISISGSNFQPGSSVMLGANTLSNVSVTPTSISADVPAGLVSGRYDLSVSVSGTTQTLSRAFGVKNAPFTVNWLQSPTTGMTLPVGDSNDIAFDPQLPATRFIANNGQGVFRSTDNGASWSLFSAGLPSNNLNSLITDLSRSGRLYLGDNSGTVFLSSNNAVNWSEQLSGQANTSQRSRMVRHPSDPDTLYTTAAFYDVTGVVFKSVNGGVSWTDITGDIPTPATVNGYDLAVDPANPQILYLGRDAGIDVMKSVNGGLNWVNANTGLPNLGATTGATRLLIHPQQSNILYAMAGGPVNSALYRSTDGAATWTALTTGLPVINPGVVYLTALALDPTYPDILYAAFNGQGVYKSIDGGNTWAQINTGLPVVPALPYVQSIAVHPQLEDYVYLGISGLGNDPLYQSQP